MAKYLVTGGAGFIGTNLVTELLKQGHAVRVLDNFIAGKFPDRLVAGAEYREGDIRLGTTVSAAAEGMDGIFHLAALPRVQYTVEHPWETHEHNVGGTLQVLLAARDHGGLRVVFSSSAAVYGDQETSPLVETMRPNPLSPYGLHKFMGEEYCRLFHKLYKVPTVSLRYFNIYGPHMDPNGAYALVVGKFLEQRRHGLPMTICGDGEYYREYAHVQDIVQANILAMNSHNVGAGEIINIGSGASTSVNELARLIGGPVEFVPPRPGDPRHNRADIAKARELLGWEPKVDLMNGIAEMKRLWNLS